MHAREVSVVERRELRHGLPHDGWGVEMGHAVRRVGKPGQALLGVEAPSNCNATSRSVDRCGQRRQSAGVEQRQRVQVLGAIASEGAHRNGVGPLPEERPVGHECALRASGRARGVEDVRRVVERAVRRGRHGPRAGRPGVEVGHAPWALPRRRGGAGEPGELLAGVRPGAVVDDESGVGVGAQRLQLGRG